MIVGVIVACEIAFWVFVAAGLGARYVLRRERLGMGLLVAAPVVDLVLLSVTAFDLGRGGYAGVAHGLAAAYLGFSVAYGHRLITWADRRAGHLRDGAPLPARPFGWEHTRQCWADVPRTLLALAVTAGVVWCLTLIGEPGHTDELVGGIRLVATVAVVDLIRALSYTLWPRRAPTSA